MAGYIGSKASVTQVDGYNRTEADSEFVNDPNDVITVSGSNVGIGTSSPDSLLTVDGQVIIGDLVAGSSNLTNLTAGTPPQLVAGWSVPVITWTPSFATEAVFTRDGDIQVDLLAGAGESSILSFSDPDDENAGQIGYDHSNNVMRIHTNGAERMRLAANGTLLLNKTSSSIATVGVELRGEQGILTATSDNASTVYFTRKGLAGGPIVNFYRDTTHAGVIGVGADADLYIGEDVVGLQFQNTGADRIDPYNPDGNSVRDNAIDLGGSSSRFDDVYATNGSIQTSDRNEKQDIAVLSDAEQRVAVACKGLLRKFRWKAAVAEKGDDARIHFGIIAQDLQDAFAAEGLDAGRYAMFISSTWWETQTEVPAVEAVAEVLDDEGNVVTEAVEAKDAYTRTDTYETLEEAPEGATERTRLGVRYPELLAFIIGAM